MLQGKFCNIRNLLEYLHFRKKTLANANETNFDLDKVKLRTEKQSCLMRRKHILLKVSKFDQLRISKCKYYNQKQPNCFHLHFYSGNTTYSEEQNEGKG